MNEVRNRALAAAFGLIVGNTLVCYGAILVFFWQDGMIELGAALLVIALGAALFAWGLR